MVSRSPSNPDFDPSRALLESLNTRLPAREFETWIKGASLRCVPPNRIVLSVPNRFHKTWLESNFKDVIRLAAQAVLETDPVIEFELSCGEDRSRDETPAPVPRAAPPPGGRPPHDISSPINHAFTFENLVVGPSNRIPCAACLAVSESRYLEDTPVYNPLVIYGRSGVGKTHLLQACYQRIRLIEKQSPLYMTCEDLTNRALDAIRHGTVSSFLKDICAFDSLILDDVQFLSGKKRVQDECDHLLTEFQSQGKQIILSCDRPPRDVPNVSARLLSRLKGGLMAKLDEPNLETRIGIVRTKAARFGFDLPAEAAEILAREFSGSPRELEGKVLELVHLHDPGRSPQELLQNVLLVLSGEHGERHSAPSPAEVSIAHIHREVAVYFKVAPADLFSSSRSRALAFARQVAMYIARELTSHSLEEIGRFFGGRDHATVVYGVQKIKRRMSEAPEVRADVETLLARLRRGSTGS